MISTLLFDFGDIFINLDKTAPKREFLKYGNEDAFYEINSLAERYETGTITTSIFFKSLAKLFPGVAREELVISWNAILKDFPKYRLEFLKHLAANKKFQLILLSNTNEAHINWVQQNIPFYEEFKSYFDVFYLSYEIKLRKPEKRIYEFVLNENNLQPQEVLFVDDTKDNIEVASAMGIQTWNLVPGKEDIIDLFQIKKNLL